MATMLDLFALLVAQKKSVLPPYLQQVDYLESTGSQYIDISINNINTGTQNTTFRCKYKPKQLPLQTNNEVIFGSMGSGNTRLRYIGYGDAYNQTIWEGTSATNIINNTELLVTNAFNNIEIKIGKDEFSSNINGAKLTSQRRFNVIQTIPLTLFCLNNNGTKQRFCNGYLKETQYEIDNILVRNLIPCYFKTTAQAIDGNTGVLTTYQQSKPCMYDAVNNKVYVNQGTGADFLVGADVNASANTLNFSTQTLQGKATPTITAERIITKGFTSGGTHYAQMYIYDDGEVWYVNGGNHATAHANNVWEIEYKTIQFDSGVFLTEEEKSALLSIYDKI